MDYKIVERILNVSPNFLLEKDLIHSGYSIIAGVDEVGRGPLAGPVTAAAVILDPLNIPENLNEGIDTGEGVDLDAYGYKLVPKNKAGNYVQKGSKLDVKQLFEDQKDFQLKRVAAFDVIEQELNDIYKMLSNAKNETSDYYNDNPSSYNVIKPTDLVLDYIKDIKDLLKGE